MYEESVFHVYIGERTDIQVAILLFNVLTNESWYGSYNGQTISVYLQPGDYEFTIQYQSTILTSCLSVPLELQLMTTNYLQSLNIPSSCSEIEPPSYLSNSLNSESYQYVKNYPTAEGEEYYHEIELDLEGSTASLYIEINYNFLLGQMDIRLASYHLDNEEPTYIISSNYMQNGAFINYDILIDPESRYVLEIFDLMPLQGLDEDSSICINYDLSVYFNNPNNPQCDVIEPLPTDLYSDAGNSNIYGGPQDSTTGRVRISGRKFPVQPTGTRQRILFKIPEESALKVYILFPDTNTNVDISIYPNTNYDSPPIEELSDYLWKLEPQDDDYMLDILFSSSPPNIFCKFFEFQLEIKTVEQIQSEIECPLYYPSPMTPETMLTLNDNTISYGHYIFNDTLLSDPVHHQIIHGIDEFYYRITLGSSSSGNFHSTIEYNFMSADFSLQLVNAINGQILIESGYYSSINTGELDFRSVLNTDIDSSIQYYYLDIVWHTTLHPFNLTSYCVPFDLTITFTNETEPHLMYIDPSEGLNINPLSDFIVTMVFSESVSYPPAEDIPTHGTVTLRSISSNEILFPISAYYHDNSTILICVFSSNDIIWGNTYVLSFQIESFRTEDSLPFVYNGDLSEYTFQDCDCGNHGECNMVNNQFICDCMEGYTGDLCDKCSTGYHGAADQCVIDIECTDDFCNGHGQCHASGAYVHCSCDEGWQTLGDDWCSICANGYFFDNGNCTITPEGTDRDTKCDAPLLPYTFDSVGYFEYNNAMHIIDNYYIDLSHSSHEITFTLESESICNIFINGIDSLNIALDIRSKTGEILYEAEQYDYGQLIYQIMPLGSYIIHLDYLPQSESSLDQSCSTVLFEVAINTLEDLSSAHPCSYKSNIPNYDRITIGNDYNYPLQKYSIHDSVREEYFASIPIHIDELPEDMHALITIEIGYQAITGHFGVLLEKGSDDNHCDNNDDSRCVYGETLNNRHIIQAIIGENEDYSIWLYRSGIYNGDCVDYTFTFSVDIITDTENEWNCPYPRPPDELSIPQYMINNAFHLSDRFFLPDTSTMALSIETESLFRMAVNSKKSTSFFYRTGNSSEWQSIESSSSTASFSTILQAGDYEIRIDSWSATINNIINNKFCDPATVEIAVLPIPDEIIPCTSPETFLPTLIPSFISAPYTFGIPSDNVPPQVYTYYLEHTGSREIIYETTFNTTDNVQFFAGVSSDFQYHQLEVIIEGLDNGISLGGNNFYNYNFLDVLLTPGTYTLSIIRNPGYDNENTFLHCVDFNFMIKLSELTTCSGTGEIMPSTFNNIRFLTGRDSFDYFSPSTRMPDAVMETQYAETYTTLVVDVDSVIRFYVEPPSGIEVKVKLQQYLTDDYYDIASAHMHSYSNPNSLIFSLSSEEAYRIWIRYEGSGVVNTLCPTFLYQVSVSPYQPPENRLCPNGGDHFNPSVPDDLPYPPYEYDSYLESLYFQQVANNLIARSSSFTIHAPTNIHAEASFDFIYTELEIRLENQDTGETIYGTRTWNQAVLHLTNIPEGNYKLKLMEAIPTLDEYLGCATFTYRIKIDAYSLTTISEVSSLYPTLPESLGTPSYLSFDGNSCFENTFMFENTPFTMEIPLSEPSIMRLRYNSDSDLEFQILDIESKEISFQTIGNSIMASLNPSTYNLIIESSNIYEQYDIEFCIQPTIEVNSDMAAWSSILDLETICQTEEWPEIEFNSGEPFYITNQYLIEASDFGEIVHSPFTLDSRAFLYIKIGYQFIANDIILTLHNELGVLSTGTLRKNEIELFTELPEGEYYITLTKPDSHILPEYCTSYSLNLVISDSGIRQDCIGSIKLPSNLNSGGIPFGGPITNGSLSFYGPSFTLYNSEHISTISFRITNSSVLSIITSVYDIPEGVSFNLFANGTYVTPISTYVSSSTQIQKLVYLLEDIYSVYTIVLNDGHSELPLLNCPTFALGIDIDEISIVTRRDGACPDTMTSPLNTITIEDGYGHQWLESSIVEQVSGATFDISFTLTESSELQAILGYQNLLSTASLSLSYANTGIGIITGSLSTQEQSVHTNEAIEIKYQLDEGEYLLQYSLTSLSIDEVIECLPFTWYTQVYPSVSNTFISNVVPASRTDVGTSETLSIDITFSGLIFSNTIPVNGNNKEPIQLAMYLQPSYSTNGLMPDNIYSLDSIGSSWKLIWESSALLAGESYLLQIHPNILFDKHNEPVNLYSENIYSVLPDCPEHQYFNSVYHSCECLPNYAGIDCKACADGYLHYPDCTPIDNCSPPCVHGECYDVECTCAPHWDGVDCSYCKSPFTGFNCTDCEFPFTGFNCSSCISPYTGVNCTECEYPFTGESCSNCIPPFTGNECEQCIYPFKGSNCSECIYPFTGNECSECIPPFTGDNCNECEYPFTGTSCSNCIPPFTGNDCEDCIPPFTGDDCTSCIAPFTGNNCTECLYPFTGRDCNECIPPFTGDDCSECQFPFDGEGCLSCVPPYAGPDCTECSFPFTGVWCTDCIGNFVGENCNYCALGFTDPSTNCTQCAPNWNEDCSDCLPNWDGPNCGYCSPHFTGDKCDICATNWEGDNCDTCPIRFKESPGNCEECSALFTGDNCLECADGFTGENCTEYIDDSSFDTVYAVDPFIYEIVVGVVAATIIGCCIVAILIMLVVRSRKRKNNQKKFIPVLDLDEEDAIELDTNPLVKVC